MGGGREMVNNPDPIIRWHNRAEELRVFADSTKDPKNREALRDWAKEYDRDGCKSHASGLEPPLF
jgi:hypothetical protein